MAAQGGARPIVSYNNEDGGEGEGAPAFRRRCLSQLLRRKLPKETNWKCHPVWNSNSRRGCCDYGDGGRCDWLGERLSLNSMKLIMNTRLWNLYRAHRRISGWNSVTNSQPMLLWQVKWRLVIVMSRDDIGHLLNRSVGAKTKYYLNLAFSSLDRFVFVWYMKVESVLKMICLVEWNLCLCPVIRMQDILSIKIRSRSFEKWHI